MQLSFSPYRLKTYWLEALLFVEFPTTHIKAYMQRDTLDIWAIMNKRVLVELASMTVLRHLYILWNLFLLNKLVSFNLCLVINQGSWRFGLFYFA